MAISWGAWDTGNTSAGFRVGVEYTISSVTSASSSVTFTTKWYVEAEFNVDDEMTVTFGGSISGSSTQNLTTGTSGGYKLWATKTYTYTYSTYGSSPGTKTFTGSLSGVYNSANPTKSITLTIPARPFAVPAAPSAVTAVRNTDNQATVAWTRNATSAAPYTSVTVQRSLWNGTAWGAWATVATTSSTATSFVDTGVVTNQIYRYQVKANNAAGSSAYVAAAASVKMTPAAPTGATATLQPSGTSIAVAWTNNHYVDAGNTITIQRSVAGGAYANVVTGLAGTTTTWTDNTPGAGTNAYQVRVVQSAGSLNSAVAQTNTVSTTVPPLAPTNLSPNGTAIDWALAQTLTWQHNPGGDGAAQSAFIIEYSNDGGTNWLPLNGGGTASTVSSYTVPAGTLTNGTSRLWRVRTRGVAAAGYGPNSASATVTGSATPVTTITAPPTTVTTLPLVATWTYSQANGSAQTAWEANLYLAGQLIEARSGTTALTTTFDYRPTAGTYTLAIRTKSAAGIWSASATRNLTISLLAPGGVTVAADYQGESGTTVVSLAARPAPGSTRTNLSTVPWGTAFWGANNTYWTRTTSETLNDHPLGIPTGIKVVVSNAASAGVALASVSGMDGLGASATSRGAGIWVKPPRDAIVKVYLDGNLAGTQKDTPAPGGAWTYCTTNAAGTGNLIGIVTTADSSATNNGEETFMTGSIVEAATASPSYFDGDFPWGAWSGTRGASTSTLAAANGVATTAATVERRVPGGDWVTLVRDVAIPNDVLDLLPSTNGITEYRVTAKSATPTYRIEPIVEVVPPNPLTADDAHDRQWVFINYGDSFTTLLRTRSNPEVSSTTSREKAGQQFLGRRKPVPALGSARSRVLQVKADLVHDFEARGDDVFLWDSPPVDWEEASLEAEVVCLRDYTGRRIFGLLSEVGTGDTRPGLGSVTFSVTEMEYTEAYA